MDDEDGIAAVIRRAQEAIEKAKRLTRAVENPAADETSAAPESNATAANAQHDEASSIDEREPPEATHEDGHNPSNENSATDVNHEQALRLRAFLRLQLLTGQDILAQLQSQQQRAEDLSLRLNAIIGPHRSSQQGASQTSDWWLAAQGAAPPPHDEQQAQNEQIRAPEPEQSSISLVAQRLATLGAQQSNTLQQLLSLRLEQLRLRQQQLSALQELLRSEAVLIVDPSPLQLSAVYQSLSLLSQSLDDMRLASAAIEAGSGALHMSRGGEESTQSLLSSLGGGGVLAETVARADQRAEHVAQMARQLLMVLREFPRVPTSPGPSASSQPLPAPGCDEDKLRSLPSAIVCFPSPIPLLNSDKEAGSSSVHVVRVSAGGGKQVALAGEQCGICLAEFCAGEVLRSCDGEVHFFHPACLFEWLRMKASCPTCRLFA
jgi:hypothetical protein